MQSEQKMTPKIFFQSLTIIHGALLAGILLFGGLTILLQWDKPNSENPNVGNQIFLLVGLGLTVMGIVTSFATKNTLVKVARSKSGLKNKLKAYQTAFVVKLALLEFPALINLVFYLLSGRQIFLFNALVVVVVIIFIRPYKLKTITEMQFNEDEKSVLDTADNIIT